MGFSLFFLFSPDIYLFIFGDVWVLGDPKISGEK